MDDLFSILIYIIIIISFLSSLFKKKTPAPPTQERRVPQDRLPEESVSVEEPKQVTDYDILREIENMFKTGTEKQPEVSRKTTKIEEAAKRPRVSYEEYASHEAFRTESEQKVTQSEHQYFEPKRRPVKVDRKVEEQAKRFQELLERNTSFQEAAVQKLVKKIKNPETLREYILVSEILARPKALRR